MLQKQLRTSVVLSGVRYPVEKRVGTGRPCFGDRLTCPPGPLGRPLVAPGMAAQ